MSSLATSFSFLALSGQVRASRPIIGAICVAVLITAGPVFFDGHNAQRLIQLALMVVVAGWAVLGSGASALAGTARFWGATPLFALFLLGCTSAWFALVPRHALAELGILSMLAIVAARIAHEVRQAPEESVQRILTTLGLGCVVYLVAVGAGYVAALALQLPMTPRDIAAGFDNHRFLNHVQTILLPLLALLAWRARPGSRHAKIWMATAACWWTLLFATGGRGTLLGVMAGCAVTWMMMGGAGRRFVRLMLALALGGLAIYALLFIAVPLALGMEPFGLLSKVGERSLSRPTSGRVEIWLAALELIRSHPWLGVGPAHFAHTGLTGLYPGHPHNWVLQFGSEWGIPATLILAYVLWRGVWSLFRARAGIEPSDTRRQMTLCAFIAVAVGIVTDSLVSGLIVMPASQLAIGLFVGMATGWLNAQASTKPARLAGNGFRLIGSLAITGVVLLTAWSIWDDLPVAFGLQEETFRTYYNPRIWHDGKFP